MQFFPNIEYNKAKRKKAYILGFASIFLLLIMFASFLQINTSVAITVGILFLFVIILLPSIIKSYPIKKKPVIEVGEKQIIYNGKYVVELKDIVGFKLNVFHPCSSRISVEIEDELNEVSKNLDKEIRFGYVDLVIKGQKKEETLFGTVLDCVGAAQALVDFGVKEYVCYVSWKKHTIVSNFKFRKTVTEQDNVINISKKKRRKQLL